MKVSLNVEDIIVLQLLMQRTGKSKKKKSDWKNVKRKGSENRSSV